MKKMSSNSTYEIYKNSPVVLAIIQFRYQKIDDFDSQAIIKAGDSIKKDYPNSNVSILQTVKLDRASETKISIGNNEVNGVRFDSLDKTKVLTVGTEKFTLEIHGKYPGWDSIEAETKKLWSLFSPLLKNLQITGLSIRYTNRINIPLETSEINKYFTTYIHSNTVDHTINQFQIRYTSTPEKGLIIHVGHLLEPAIEGTLPYIFDIDVISIVEIPNEENKIWELFSKLRNQKNSIFNEGITEETKKLIR